MVAVYRKKWILPTSPASEREKWSHFLLPGGNLLVTGFPSSFLPWSPCNLTSKIDKKRFLRFQICKIQTQLSFRSTHLLGNWHVPVSCFTSNSPNLRVAFLPLQKSSVHLETFVVILLILWKKKIYKKYACKSTNLLLQSKLAFWMFWKVGSFFQSTHPTDG